MSVIVMGMEIPESCDECKLCSVDSSMIGYCYLLDEYSDSESTHIERHPNCPLIEVPTPHGRLIDAAKLDIHDISPVDGFCVMGVTEEDIGLADTVIEAEVTE